jgi:hypothetical protein
VAGKGIDDVVGTTPRSSAGLTPLRSSSAIPSAVSSRSGCEQWLPPGWFIAAVYSDVESGTDLDKRSQGDGWKVLTAAGLPRDGGMADLLAEAASPAPSSRRWCARPPIIDKATWQAAQSAGAEHGTSRDTDDTTPVPATGRT